MMDIKMAVEMGIVDVISEKDTDTRRAYKCDERCMLCTIGIEYKESSLTGCPLCGCMARASSSPSRYYGYKHLTFECGTIVNICNVNVPDVDMITLIVIGDACRIRTVALTEDII